MLKLSVTDRPVPSIRKARAGNAFLPLIAVVTKEEAVAGSRSWLAAHECSVVPDAMSVYHNLFFEIEEITLRASQESRPDFSGTSF